MDRKKMGLLGLGVLAIAAAGYPYHPEVTSYTLVSSKLEDVIRIVVLSDLHGSKFGRNMEELILNIKGQNPDFIVIPGDLFDEYSDEESGWTLVMHLQDYPVYYVSGNHEEHRQDTENLMERIRLCGVRVINEKTAFITVGDTTVEIGGVSGKEEESYYQPDEITSLYTSANYRILLSHIPSLIEVYEHTSVDLIISGHAHGGQWRIPKTEIGLFSPQQGFFPKYVGGLHTIGTKKLVIGRGLCRTYHYLPRLFNNPEIVSLTLMPSDLQKLQKKETDKYVEKITAGTESL